MKLFLSFALAFNLHVMTALSAGLQQLYPTFNLETYCSSPGSIIDLPCDFEATDRAGTFKFSDGRYPQFNCSMTMRVRGQYCLPTGNYAIYFNIRSLSLRTGDSLEIYQYGLSGGTDGPMKTLSTDITPSTNPTSYGQLRTNYSRTPTFRLNFRTKFNSAFTPYTYRADSLALDYIVVRTEYNTAYETKCIALDGYILDTHFCETGDRVNCPSIYDPNSMALSTQISKPFANIPSYCSNTYSTTTTPTTTTRQYPTWYYINDDHNNAPSTTYKPYPVRPTRYSVNDDYNSHPRYDNPLSDAALAGVIVGVVVLVIIVLVIVLTIRLYVFPHVRTVVYQQENVAVISAADGPFIYPTSGDYLQLAPPAFGATTYGVPLASHSGELASSSPPAYSSVYPTAPLADSHRF